MRSIDPPAYAIRHAESGLLCRRSVGGDDPDGGILWDYGPAVHGLGERPTVWSTAADAVAWAASVPSLREQSWMFEVVRLDGAKATRVGRLADLIGVGEGVAS